MPFCPSCRTEYVSGVERCADCDSLLVEALPEETPEAGTKLVLLAVFPNAAAARLVQELLANNGIEAVLRGDMDPIGNVLANAPALLVQESALPQARDFYEAFFAGSEDEPGVIPPEEAPGETNSN